jgi:hypothetical protein
MKEAVPADEGLLAERRAAAPASDVKLPEGDFVGYERED